MNGARGDPKRYWPEKCYKCGRRGQLAALAAVAVLLLQACLPQQGAQSARVEVLGHGNHCGKRDQGAHWIEADDVEDRLAVDPREGYRLLLISQGERPTGGFGVSLNAYTLERGRVRVRLHLKKPSGDELVTQALTRPCLVLGIPGAADVVELQDTDGRVLSELEVP
ncbi:protease complex subunit PrcB family protein [Aquisalimonas sp.]|uniref:protease complex subunit PrcB family protein n=1 Tax=Aquisalimonas sp. TaxID=1872621 RepID=UPI0025BD36C7|nr:protease complex subunit PrcB family protein [Aquisalimonas sp.]